jgi:hypothetical protein
MSARPEEPMKVFCDDSSRHGTAHIPNPLLITKWAYLKHHSERVVAYSDAKVANRNGWVAHAISRRPTVSLNTIVARTHMYTYAASVWDFVSFKGHFLSRRAQASSSYVRFASKPPSPS